jgi:hypothetical protein
MICSVRFLDVSASESEFHVELRLRVLRHVPRETLPAKRFYLTPKPAIMRYLIDHAPRLK